MVFPAYPYVVQKSLGPASTIRIKNLYLLPIPLYLDYCEGLKPLYFWPEVRPVRAQSHARAHARERERAFEDAFLCISTNRLCDCLCIRVSPLPTPATLS